MPALPPSWGASAFPAAVLATGYVGPGGNANLSVVLPATPSKTWYLTLAVLNMGRGTVNAQTYAFLLGLAGGSPLFELSTPPFGFAGLTIPFDPAVQAAGPNTAVSGFIAATGVGGPAISATLVGYLL